MKTQCPFSEWGSPGVSETRFILLTRTHRAEDLQIASNAAEVFGYCLSNCCYLHSCLSLTGDLKPDCFSNEKKLMVKLVFPPCKFLKKKVNIFKSCFPGPFWPALWPYTNLFLALLSLPLVLCLARASLLQQSAFPLAAVNIDSLYPNLVAYGSGWWFGYMDFFIFQIYILQSEEIFNLFLWRLPLLFGYFTCSKNSHPFFTTSLINCRMIWLSAEPPWPKHKGCQFANTCTDPPRFSPSEWISRFSTGRFSTQNSSSVFNCYYEGSSCAAQILWLFCR